MTIRASWASIGLGLLLALGGGPAGAREDDASEAKALAERVDAYLEPVVEAGLFSGTVLLARNGEVLVEKAYGSADIAADIANTASTRFKLMSVTKSITAVTLLRLVEADRLSIEDPVSKHLPGWPSTWRSVRIRHLMDHTSGLPNLENEWAMEARRGVERGLGVWRALAPRLAERAAAGPAGSQHRYANFNYVLLGAVVEAVAERPYAEVVKAEVFEPAGMSASGFDDGSLRPGLARGYFRGIGGVPDPRGQDMSSILAAGGMFSTAGDLHRFDRALASGKLLSAETVRRMHTPGANTYGYALGWQVRPIHGHACARHSGGANGYVADLLRFTDDDACVALVSNYAFAPSVLLAEDLAGLLFGREIESPARVLGKALDAYTGIYRGGDTTAYVRRSGDCLALYELKGSRSRVTPNLLVALGEHRFRRQAWPPTLRFNMQKRAADQLVIEGPQGATLPSADVDMKPWRKAAGSYTAVTDNSAYEILRAKRLLKLRLPAGWTGAELELVPLDDERALVLFQEDFATVLVLGRDEKGTVSGFRWTRNDGQVIACKRTGR